MGKITPEILEDPEPLITNDDYLARVAAEGFVPATAIAVTQVLANTAKIAGLEAVIAELKIKVDKLKPPK